MNYLWVLVLFTLYVAYSYLVKRMLKEENEKRKKAGEVIIPIVNEEENKYNLKAAPFLNLRIMSVFLRVEEEKDRETLRGKLIQILEEAQLNPARYLALNVSKILFFTVIIYSTIFFFKEEPNAILSYATIGVAALTMILKKRYVLMLIVVGFGYVFYPNIPGTVMLLILLNRLLAMFKK